MISAIEWNRHNGRIGGAIIGALDPALVELIAANDAENDGRNRRMPDVALPVPIACASGSDLAHDNETELLFSHPMNTAEMNREFNAYCCAVVRAGLANDFDAHREWRAIMDKQDRERDERFFPGLNGEGDAA